MNRSVVMPKIWMLACVPLLIGLSSPMLPAAQGLKCVPVNEQGDCLAQCATEIDCVGFCDGFNLWIPVYDQCAGVICDSTGAGPGIEVAGTCTGLPRHITFATAVCPMAPGSGYPCLTITKTKTMFARYTSADPVVSQTPLGRVGSVSLNLTTGTYVTVPSFAQHGDALCDAYVGLPIVTRCVDNPIVPPKTIYPERVGLPYECLKDSSVKLDVNGDGVTDFGQLVPLPADC